MFFLESHGKPHIHAKHGGDTAVFAIETGEPLAGNLPRPQMRLVQAWIEIHRSELLDGWKKSAGGSHPPKVEPLK